MVVAIVLGVSSKMWMPISTPHNALTYSLGKLNLSDFMRGEINLRTLAPIIFIAWIYYILMNSIL